MKQLTRALLALLLTYPTLTAVAQIRLSIGVPDVHINLGIRAYPTLEAVPGYPVYYAPNVRSNYFFYDGLYWIYESDDWYASTWYDGPWDHVDRYEVPVFLLRIPVRYYRDPPRHFVRWRADAPPRWSEHWGRDWQQRRAGWDRWNHRSPARSPRPDYQRDYAGDRYPHGPQRTQIESRSYRYQPRDSVVIRHRDQQREQSQGRDQEQRREQQKGREHDQGREQQKDREHEQDREYDQDREREQRSDNRDHDNRKEHQDKGRGRDKK